MIYLAYENRDYTHLSENEKQKIELIAQAIRNKAYGIDVRESIALAIEWVNREYKLTIENNLLTLKEFENAKAKVSTLELDMDEFIQRYSEQIAGNTSLDETIDARVDATGVSHTTLKDRLDSDTTNPSFLNSETQELGVGSELVDVSKAILGTGWTLSNSAFTHVTGNGEPLTIPLNDISSANQYQITIGVTNPASGPGGQSDFWLSLGGTKEFETYDGGSSQYKYVIYAGDTDDNLVIRPWIDYAGAITVSVKQITGSQLKPFISLYDFENKLASEMRFGKQGTDSLYIGYNSGRWSPDGYRNTAMGNIAMSRMTTGFWNTAQGYGTLQENTVGTRNVALGYIALRNNISGDRNIGIGSFALTNLKTGRNNVAIGVDTYYHATQGDGNIAIGLLALATNPHSEFNIAIGNNSMSGSNGGTANVALGNDTLRTNKSVGNVAVGDKALASNVDGASNVAVGINAGRYAKNGQYNVAIGENSGMYNEGTENVIIGRRASQYLESGSKGNVALGNLSLQNATGGNNNVAIGNGAMSRNQVNVGDGNVAIGQNALRWADNAQGNVALGDNALQLTQTGRRNIAIGQSAGNQLTTGFDNIIIGGLLNVPSPTANKQLNIGGAITSDNYDTGTIDIKRLKLTDLPTSNPNVTGVIWNDGGTLKIS